MLDFGDVGFRDAAGAGSVRYGIYELGRMPETELAKLKGSNPVLHTLAAPCSLPDPDNQTRSPIPKPLNPEKRRPEPQTQEPKSQAQNPSPSLCAPQTGKPRDPKP